MVFEPNWIIVASVIVIFLFYFVRKFRRQSTLMIFIVAITLPLFFYGFFTIFNPTITIGGNTQTNDVVVNDCSITEERGSFAYLDFKYKDNKFCEVSPDGVSWKAICKEGIC